MIVLVWLLVLVFVDLCCTYLLFTLFAVIRVLIWLSFASCWFACDVFGLLILLFCLFVVNSVVLIHTLLLDVCLVVGLISFVWLDSSIVCWFG